MSPGFSIGDFRSKAPSSAHPRRPQGVGFRVWCGIAGLSLALRNSGRHFFSGLLENQLGFVGAGFRV